MSERFVRVFKLPENIYSEGAPVIISAGALLKDNQTKKILAQLKIKSISNKPIKAVRVLITSFDTLGKQLEDKMKYEYLDLDVYRDCEFGQKVPIPLLDSSARAFSVVIDEVIFEDNGVWQYGGQEIKPLKEQKRLIDSLKDVELLVQYKKKYGEKCDYEMTEDRDLWRCSCGAINRQSEYICHECECSLDDLENVDWEKLAAEKDERLKKSKSKREKRIKLIALIVFICVAVTSISILWGNYIKKRNIYNNAIALLQSDSEGKYIKAYDDFRKLGTYKDSKEKAQYALMNVIVSKKDLALAKTAVRNICRKNDANFLTAYEIESKIIGSWITLFDEPRIILEFNNNKTITQIPINDNKSIYNYVEWGVENDELKIQEISDYDKKKMENGYKVVYISDDILALYRPELDYIAKFYIRQNSEWADKCLKHYGIQ